MATSAAKYLSNVVKSVKYASVSALKDMNPVIVDAMDTNADILKSTYTSVKKLRKTTKRAMAALPKSQFAQLATEAKHNLFEDLKNGTFYNNARLQADQEDGSFNGFFDDAFEDFDPGNDDFGGDSMPNFDIRESLDKTGQKISNSIGMATARATEYQVEAHRESTKRLLIQQAATSAAMHRDMSAINSNIAGIIEFNNEAMRTHIENSKTFYETQTNLMQESNAMLRELLELNKSVFTPQRKDREKFRLQDIFTSEGNINASKYIAMVKSNFAMSDVGSTLGQIKDILSMDGGGEFVKNPLGFVMTSIMKSLTPETLKQQFSEFNKTISGAFGTALMNLSKLKDSSNPLLSMIGQMFGANSQLKNALDVSAYEKGAQTWNGKNSKALNEVIPTLLSKIYSAVSGKPEVRFDYNTGKFRSIKSIKKEQQDIQSRYIYNTFREINPYMRAQLAKTKMSKEEMEEFMQQLNNVYEYSFFKADNINPKKGISANKYRFRGPNANRNAKIMSQMFKNVPPNVMMDLATRIYENRDNMTRWMEDLEESGDSVLNALFNGSLKFDKKGKTKSNAKGSVKAPVSLGDKLDVTNDLLSQILFTISHGKRGDMSEGNLSREERANAKKTRNWKARHNRTTTPQANNNTNNPQPDSRGSRNIISAMRQKMNSLINKHNQNVNKINQEYDRGKISYATLQTQLAAEDTVFQEEMKSYYSSDYIGDIDVDDDAIDVNELMRRIDSGYFDQEEGRVDFSKSKYVQSIKNAKSPLGKLANFAKGIGMLATQPIQAIGNVMKIADKKLYDMLFSDGTNSEQSVMGMMKDKFNKWFSDLTEQTKKTWTAITNSLQANSFGDKIKSFAKNLFGIDIENISASIKDALFGDSNIDYGTGFRNLGRATVQQTLNTLGLKGIDMNPAAASKYLKGTLNESGKAKAKRNKAIDSYAAMAANLNVDGTGETEDIPQAASGMRRVSKTGVVAVSEGEMIIPSDLNPFNIKKREKNEKKAIGRFQKANKNSYKGIPYYAAGTTNVRDAGDKSNMTDAEIYATVKYYIEQTINRTMTDDQVQSNFREIAVNNENGAARLQAAIKKYNRYHREKFTRDDYEAGQENFAIKMGDAAKDMTAPMKETTIYENLSSRISSIVESTKGKEARAETKKVMENFHTYLPKMLMGGTGGLLVSSIFGLAGGPLLGAAVGAAAGLVQQSGGFQKILFGNMTDENGQLKSDGSGLLSKDIANNIYKYAPDMAKGAALGGIASLLPIFPGGPIAGILIGSALGFAKHNESFSNALFGGKDNAKKMMDTVKSKLPKMAVGSVAMSLLGGPFGFTGNLMLGAALGFVSDTDKFKDTIFGYRDATGKRHGGLVGYFVDAVKVPVDYLKDMFKFYIDGISKKVLTPLVNITKPLVQGVLNIGTSIKDRILGGLNTHFIKPLAGVAKRVTQGIEKAILAPITKAMKGIFNIATLPLRALGRLGVGMQRRQLSTVGKSSMAGRTAAERQRARIAFDEEHNGIFRRGLDMGTKRSVAARADEFLAGSSDEDLQTALLTARMDKVGKGKFGLHYQGKVAQYAITRKLSGKYAGQRIDGVLTSMVNAGKITKREYDMILKELTKGKCDASIALLRNTPRVSDDEVDTLEEMFDQVIKNRAKAIEEFNSGKGNAILKEAKKRGLNNKNFLKLAQKELNARGIIAAEEEAKRQSEEPQTEDDRFNDTLRRMVSPVEQIASDIHVIAFPNSAEAKRRRQEVGEKNEEDVKYSNDADGSPIKWKKNSQGEWIVDKQDTDNKEREKEHEDDDRTQESIANRLKQLVKGFGFDRRKKNEEDGEDKHKKGFLSSILGIGKAGIRGILGAGKWLLPKLAVGLGLSTLLGWQVNDPKNLDGDGDGKTELANVIWDKAGTFLWGSTGDGKKDGLIYGIKSIFTQTIAPWFTQTAFPYVEKTVNTAVNWVTEELPKKIGDAYTKHLKPFVDQQLIPSITGGVKWAIFEGPGLIANALVTHAPTILKGVVNGLLNGIGKLVNRLFGVTEVQAGADDSISISSYKPSKTLNDYITAEKADAGYTNPPSYGNQVNLPNGWSTTTSSGQAGIGENASQEVKTSTRPVTLDTSNLNVKGKIIGTGINAVSTAAAVASDVSKNASQAGAESDLSDVAEMTIRNLLTGNKSTYGVHILSQMSDKTYNALIKAVNVMPGVPQRLKKAISTSISMARSFNNAPLKVADVVDAAMKGYKQGGSKAAVNYVSKVLQGKNYMSPKVNLSVAEQKAEQAQQKLAQLAEKETENGKLGVVDKVRKSKAERDLKKNQKRVDKLGGNVKGTTEAVDDVADAGEDAIERITRDTAKIADNADDVIDSASSLKKHPIWSNLLKHIKNFIEDSKVAKAISNGMELLSKCIDKVNKAGAVAITKISSNVVEKIAKFFGEKAQKTAMAISAKASAWAASGGTVLIASLVADFVSGFKNADANIGVEKPSALEKAISVIGQEIANNIFGGLVSPTRVCNLIIEVFETLGFDFTNLRLAQKRMDDIVAAYNKETGENLTVYDFIMDQKLFSRLTKAFTNNLAAGSLMNVAGSLYLTDPTMAKQLQQQAMDLYSANPSDYYTDANGERQSKSDLIAKLYNEYALENYTTESTGIQSTSLWDKMQSNPAGLEGLQDISNTKETDERNAQKKFWANRTNATKTQSTTSSNTTPEYDVSNYLKTTSKEDNTLGTFKLNGSSTAYQAGMENLSPFDRQIAMKAVEEGKRLLYDDGNNVIGIYAKDSDDIETMFVGQSDAEETSSNYVNPGNIMGVSGDTETEIVSNFNKGVRSGPEEVYKKINQIWQTSSDMLNPTLLNLPHVLASGTKAMSRFLAIAYGFADPGKSGIDLNKIVNDDAYLDQRADEIAKESPLYKLLNMEYVIDFDKYRQIHAGAVNAGYVSGGTSTITTTSTSTGLTSDSSTLPLIEDTSSSSTDSTTGDSSSSSSSSTTKKTDSQIKNEQTAKNKLAAKKDAEKKGISTKKALNGTKAAIEDSIRNGILPAAKGSGITGSVKTAGDDPSSFGTSFVSQTYSRYASTPFSVKGDTEKATVADAGCAPAAATMIINDLNNMASTPISMDQAIKDALNYKLPDSGVTADYFVDEFEKHGFGTTFVAGNNKNTKNTIVNALRYYQPVVLMGADPTNKTKVNSPFGPQDHYVVATKLSKDGKYVFINDPESKKGNIKYKLSEILNRVRLGIIPMTSNPHKKITTTLSSKVKQALKRFAGKAVGTIVYVGDSRVLGMKDAIGQSDSIKFIGKVSAGYAWLKSTAGALAKQELERNKNAVIVFCFGINDCYGTQVKKYTEFYEDFKKYSSNVWFMSVNPVDEEKAKKYKYTEKNVMVEAFNAKLKEYAGARYIDTYTYLKTNGFNTSDGIHYTTDTYKKIHEYTMSVLDGNVSVNTTTAPSINSQAGGAISSTASVSGDPLGTVKQLGANGLKGGLADILSLFDQLATAWGFAGQSTTTSAASGSTTSVVGPQGGVLEVNGGPSGATFSNGIATLDFNGEHIQGPVCNNQTNADAQVNLVKKMLSVKGKLKYAQNNDKYPGSRNPDDGSGDCSSTVQWAYKKITGVDIGGYTGAQDRSTATYAVDTVSPWGSRQFDESKLQLGDILLYANPNDNSDPTTHVEMYMGSGTIVGHGSGYGPKVRTINTFQTGSHSTKVAKRLNQFSGMGSGIPLVSQTASQYDNLTLGKNGDSVATSGCAPAVASMYSSYLGINKPMESTVDEANQYYNSDTGVSADYFIDQFNKAGYNGQVLDNQYNIANALNNHTPVVLLGQNTNNTTKDASPFGPTSHYVLATGMQNGKVLINDPEGNEEDKAYNASILKDATLGISATKDKIRNGGLRYERKGAKATGIFPTYNLTEPELKGMANIIQHEIGTTEGRYGQAAMMANRTDRDGNENATKDRFMSKNLYLAYGRREYNDAYSGKVTPEADAYQAAVDTFNNGIRTLPRYVDEHDYIKTDISYLEPSGDKYNRASYKQHQTKIHNAFGSTYTFYSFPSSVEGSDPYGYTNTKYREKWGDQHYDFNNIAGGVVNGSGGTAPSMPKFSDLTDDQIERLACIIQSEQPGIKGWYAEASQMANLSDIRHNDQSTAANLIQTAKSGWYAHGTTRYDNKVVGSGESLDPRAAAVAKNVFVNGYRTLPRYVDEHDYEGDISSVSTGPKEDHSHYKMHESVIKNNMGSTYKFYEFPTPQCDPFGYTSDANRTKYGDARWLVDENGNITGSEGGLSATGGTSSSGTASTVQEGLSKVEILINKFDDLARAYGLTSQSETASATTTTSTTGGLTGGIDGSTGDLPAASIGTSVNEGQLWALIKSKTGATDFGVAGIMGNLYAESGLKSNSVENAFENKVGDDTTYTSKIDAGTYSKSQFMSDSAGYGLAQWTSSNRKGGLYDNTRAKGVSISDASGQVDWLNQELNNGYKTTLNAMKTGSSVRAVSDVVLKDFERPADQSEAVQQKRASYGQAYYDRYAGKDLNSLMSGSSSGSTSTGKTESQIKNEQTAKQKLAAKKDAESKGLSTKKAAYLPAAKGSSILSKFKGKGSGISNIKQTPSYAVSGKLANTTDKDWQAIDMMNKAEADLRNAEPSQVSAVYNITANTNKNMVKLMQTVIQLIGQVVNNTTDVKTIATLLTKLLEGQEPDKNYGGRFNETKEKSDQEVQKALVSTQALAVSALKKSSSNVQDSSLEALIRSVEAIAVQ